MGGEEFRELEAAMLRTKRTCKGLKYACGVCLIVFSIMWMVLLGTLVVAFAADLTEPGILKELLYTFIYGAIIIILFFSFFISFSDIAKGVSPFTMKQVSRFRFAALLLVLLVIVDAFLSVGFVHNLDVAGVGVSAFGNNGVEQPQIRINGMDLLFAAILYGVSVLLRYGVLLQRLTDETE